MSSYARTTTPAYSANPFQAFVTYKQARRAAKGGGVVALVYGALSILGFLQFMLGANLRMPPAIRQMNLAVIAILTVLMLLLGWRLWLKPGRWKSLVLLLLALVNLIGAVVQFSVPSLVIMAVTLNFSVIAFRGALAMRRLEPQSRMQTEIEVF